MATLTYSTGETGYSHIVRHVREHGSARSPRGVKTYDVGHTVIELATPFRGLALSCNRRLNQKIAAAEAIQLIGGFAAPHLLTKASTRFAEYAEEGGQFHGAYGRRIGHQMLNVAHKLFNDPDTRQAVITLWDPFLDNQPGKKDYPCTVMLQFEVDSRGRLCMNVVMRSNDVWLGLPYDIFQFTQLQISLANALGRFCGSYRHTTLSLHLYERDADRVDDLVHVTEVSPEEQPAGVGEYQAHDFATIMKRARQLSARTQPKNETRSERWYRDIFTSYLA